MVSRTPLDRRSVLTGLLAGPLLLTSPILAGPALADDVIDLNWEDLRPDAADSLPKVLRGVLQHEEASRVSQQPASTGVRTDWNGQTVRLPGYIVPLEYKGSGVTAFLLVPFVGACVHVPPPPANQLVFVTTQDPYETAGLFEPVYVTGMFGVSSLSTQLADVGYALSADEIVPYQF